MDRQKTTDGSPDKDVRLNLAVDDGIDKDSVSIPESELFKTFDGNRRSFLKKLLISSAYVTPVILSFSISDAEAKKKTLLPTKKK